MRLRSVTAPGLLIAPATFACALPIALAAGTFSPTSLRAQSASVPAADVHYALDMTLAPDRGTAEGRMIVRFPPGDTLARLDLTAEGGRWIRLDAVATDDGTRVRFGPPDASGKVAGAIPPDARSLHVDFTAPMDSLLVEPFGYYLLGPLGSGRSWTYPELLDGAGASHRAAHFDVRITAPSGLSVYTTGGEGRPITGEAGEGEGRTLADEAGDGEGPPLLDEAGDRQVRRYSAAGVQGFAIVAGEGFRVERQETEGAPVVAFFHPDLEERFRFVIDRTVEAADWYARTYGFFPLDQIGIIQGHPRFGGGYPLPNMFAVHLGNLGDEHLAWITAHELGHYYWGYTVHGEDGLDWLMLALGIWGDQRYMAERDGVSIATRMRRDRGQGASLVGYLEALAAGHEQRLGLPSSEVGDLGFDYNLLVRHGKAATGIYLQSLLLGPDRFLELQHRLLRDYAGDVLTVDAFIDALVAAGVVDARAFFDAWRTDDAAIEVLVDAVEPAADGQGWVVALRRTGSVPYPVTVAVEPPIGTSAAGVDRHEMAASAVRDTIRVPERPARVTIDPDGLIPSFNSGHPEMRSAVAAALERARRDEVFFGLARGLLGEHPEDYHLRYRLARRLYLTGDWAGAAATWPAGRVGCDSRDECLAALYAARGLARSGDPEGARDLLAATRRGAEGADLGGTWEGELQAPGGP